MLPPFARQDSRLSAKILDFFAGYGYEQVSPPLLEYSDNLLDGRGAELSSQMFRVMDPTAHRVMAIRPDITLQIARIAAKQLKDAPRPLRLCYNGLILRLQGDQLRHNRQLRQTGIELIGAASAQADAEVIILAARAVDHLGIRDVTIDLNLPAIVGRLIADDGLQPNDIKSLYAALAHKDITALRAISLRYGKSLAALVEHVGDADLVMRGLGQIDLPPAARQLCNHLQEVLNLVKSQLPSGCNITIDVTERQGHAYHSGVGFSLFVPGVAYEVGRGGRYHAGNEEATGFTLYIELLRDLLPAAVTGKKLLLEAGCPQADCERLQQQGYTTLYALSHAVDLQQQAQAMGCAGFFAQGKLTEW